MCVLSEHPRSFGHVTILDIDWQGESLKLLPSPNLVLREFTKKESSLVITTNRERRPLVQKILIKHYMKQSYIFIILKSPQSMYYGLSFKISNLYIDQLITFI